MLEIKEEDISDSDQQSNDEWPDCAPPELTEGTTEKNKLDLLPSKSKKLYECTYDTFVKWKREHKMKLTTESIVMAYFKELSQKYKPSTLWSIYSMLKATLKIKENIEIDTYHTFKAFMKKQSSGFISKKSKVLSSENIEKFLSEAPDSKYLATKVALIFGITGACGSNELVSIRQKDITKQGDLLVVNLPITKTKKPRTFVISEEYTKIVQQYADLRPQNTTTDRFFLNFQKGRCTPQVIGIHKFSRMAKEIAIYLQLDDPESYTGHAFRRTSATLFSGSGANITILKRHSGWKTNDVAETYIEESDADADVDADGDADSDIDAPPPKRQKSDTTTSEQENSNAQWSANSNMDPLTQPYIVLKNCTIIINQK